MAFANVDSRFMNSRYKNIWVEAFFIFAMTWSFGSLLKPNAKKEFEKMIKKNIAGNKEELSTIAQLKNKFS